MLWWPNSQYVSPRHVQYINRSQLLITDLQPAEDGDPRLQSLPCDANEPVLLPASRLPSISASLSSRTFSRRSPRPSLRPPHRSSLSSQFLPAALSLSLSPLCHLNPSFYAFAAPHHVSQTQRRDSAPTMGLFTCA